MKIQSWPPAWLKTDNAKYDKSKKYFYCKLIIGKSEFSFMFDKLQNILIKMAVFTYSHSFSNIN